MSSSQLANNEYEQGKSGYKHEEGNTDPVWKSSKVFDTVYKEISSLLSYSNDEPTAKYCQTIIGD